MAKISKNGIFKRTSRRPEHRRFFISSPTLIVRNSFVRRSIALNLSFRLVQKRASHAQYRRRRRRKTKVDEFPLKMCHFVCFRASRGFFFFFVFSKKRFLSSYVCWQDWGVTVLLVHPVCFFV